jgi:hypothetical protein
VDGGDLPGGACLAVGAEGEIDGCLASVECDERAGDGELVAERGGLSVVDGEAGSDVPDQLGAGVLVPAARWVKAPRW